MGTYSAAIIQKYDEEIADRDKKIADRDKIIADRDEKIADRDEKIADLTEAVVNADQRAADASKRILLQFARKYLSAGMSPEWALAELADIAAQSGLSQQDLAEIITNAQQLQLHNQK